MVSRPPSGVRRPCFTKDLPLCLVIFAAVPGRSLSQAVLSDSDPTLRVSTTRGKRGPNDRLPPHCRQIVQENPVHPGSVFFCIRWDDRRTPVLSGRHCFLHRRVRDTSISVRDFFLSARFHAVAQFCPPPRLRCFDPSTSFFLDAFVSRNTGRRWLAAVKNWISLKYRTEAPAVPRGWSDNCWRFRAPESWIFSDTKITLALPAELRRFPQIQKKKKRKRTKQIPRNVYIRISHFSQNANNNALNQRRRTSSPPRATLSLPCSSTMKISSHSVRQRATQTTFPTFLQL